QTANQAEYKVQQLFNGSTSTNRNSIYYSFVINSFLDAYGQVDLKIWVDYCKSKSNITADCICDTYSTSYPDLQCMRDKLCKFDLIHQTPANCPCLSTCDPRAGQGQCPKYCVKGYTNTTCACDTGSSIYPSESCEKDKLCIIDLVNQTKTDCPCLMKGDPRAGDICPSYCISKAELTINCMCELGSLLYPQAQCERDKLCVVDIIHQSTSNCPCLEVDDPRGELVYQQTEIDPSDPDPTDPIIPDPTDPIIPDPTEKDPETEQEQGSGSKQDDEKKTEKEESKTFNMIWIIFIVVAGVLLLYYSLSSNREIRRKQLKQKRKIKKF
ncbi:MAG: hypothetical protein EZS28_050237, partial [Streblomastix strix]